MAGAREGRGALQGGRGPQLLAGRRLELYTELLDQPAREFTASRSRVKPRGVDQRYCRLCQQQFQPSRIHPEQTVGYPARRAGSAAAPRAVSASSSTIRSADKSAATAPANCALPSPATGSDIAPPCPTPSIASVPSSNGASASPQLISRRGCARPSWQNSTATNRVQRPNLRSRRSAWR